MQIEKGQKVFFSFAYTGLDSDVIEKRMRTMYDVLEDLGVSPYCHLYDVDLENFKSPGQFVEATIKKLQGCDVLLAIKVSSHRSEGQLMEIGAAKAWGLPIILLLHENATENTYLNDKSISKQTIIWSSEDDLLKKVKQLVA